MGHESLKQLAHASDKLILEHLQQAFQSEDKCAWHQRQGATVNGFQYLHDILSNLRCNNLSMLTCNPLQLRVQTRTVPPALHHTSCRCRNRMHMQHFTQEAMRQSYSIC